MAERNTVPCIEKELNGLSQLSCCRFSNNLLRKNSSYML